MNRLLRTLPIVVLLAALVAPGLAAESIAVRIDGVTQGWIQGDNAQSSLGRENTIEGVEYHHLVSTPTGTSTPKHEVVILLKRIDRSTPKLWRAYNNRESLTVVFKYFRPNPIGDGTTQQFYTLTLRNARIVGIENITSSTLDPATSTAPSFERIRFEYRTLTIEYPPTGDGFEIAVP